MKNTFLLISIGDGIYMFLLQVIFWVIFVYGFLSLMQDIYNEFTYKKVSHNMKIVVFAKSLEKDIEQFIIELYNMKKANAYKQIVVIDLQKDDDIDKIKTRLYEQILFIIKHGDSIGRNPVVMFFGIRTVTGIRENINYFSHRT